MARIYDTGVQRTDAAANPGSNVPIATSDTLVAAARPGRVLLILNNQDAANPVFLRFGTGAATAAGVRLAAGQTLTLDAYTGEVRAIATGATVALGVADI